MNIEKLKFVLEPLLPIIFMLVAIVIIGICAFFLKRIVDSLENKVRPWFKKHKKVRRGVIAGTVIVKTGAVIIKKGLITVLVGWILISLAYAGLAAIMDHKSPHQKRVGFLVENCWRIDYGYEILNDGRLSYKCPNGREYKE